MHWYTKNNTTYNSILYINNFIFIVDVQVKIQLCVPYFSTPRMPVGLEETFHGVKIAPDITYTNTFQYPERSHKVTSLRTPANRRLYSYINAKITFAKPNVEVIARPHTRHAYDETRASLEILTERGLVKSLRREQNEIVLQPLAYLNRVPPTTPMHPKKQQSKFEHRDKRGNIPPYSSLSFRSEPYVIGRSTAATPSCYSRNS